MVAHIQNHDVRHTLFRLRESVRFTPQSSGNTVSYLVECTGTKRFFQLGYSEYLFVSLLDGRTTFAEALAIVTQRLGTRALGSAKAKQLVEWLVTNQLITLSEQTLFNGSTKCPRPSEWGLFSWKLSLGNPDPLIRRLTTHLGWLFSPVVVGLQCILIGMAILCIADKPNRLSHAAHDLVAPDNWFWLGAVGLFLKMLHELGHALACRCYGVQVSGCGVVFLFFVPLPYVDVTQSYKLDSRWVRIHIAAAGMLFELTVAAIAVFVGLNSESPAVQHIAANTVFLAGFAAVVFNANPLMKFDGYYILSDLIECPNLYAESATLLRNRVGHALTGIRRVPWILSRNTKLLMIYGVAAYAWRMMVCLTLIVTSSTLLGGAGIAISVFAIVSWYLRPSWRIVQVFADLTQTNPRAAARAAAILSTMFVIIGGTAMLPSNMTVSSPGVVDLDDDVLVRSRVSGFIAQVHAKRGQSVNAGDLLLTLSNDEILRRYQDLDLQISQTRMQYRIHIDEHQTSEAQVANRNMTSQHEQLLNAKRDCDALQLRSDRSGKVIARELDNRMGEFVQAGDVLLAIDDQQPLQFRALVTELDAPLVATHQGQEVEVRLSPGTSLLGCLRRIEPTASTQLQDRQLASTAGGPLTVMANAGTDLPVLSEPRFLAVVELEQDARAVAFAGQRGTVYFGRRRESIGAFFWRQFERRIARLLERARIDLPGIAL